MNIAFIYMNNVRNVGRGAGYVVASIPNEHYVAFYDTAYIDPKILPKIVINKNPDIVMISTTTMFFQAALQLSGHIKSIKDVPVIMGGVHPTVVGKGVLLDYSEIDYLCIGEGESFVKEFLRKFEYGTEDELHKIQNLAWRGDTFGEIHCNKLRPPEDLSCLPSFPWLLFPKIAVDKERFIYVHATRGCPYRCTYCNNSTYLDIYGKDYIRQRPIELIIEELVRLKRYQPGVFYFGDEMILANKEYAYALFEAIKAQVNIPYGCMVRPEYIVKDAVKLLKDTGCVYLAMGIECGNEIFRKTYLSRYTCNEDIINAFRLCREAKITTCSFNMIGWPVSNDDYLCRETINLNKKIKPDIMQVTWFYPFPGTKLYDHCVRYDKIDTSLLLYSYHKGSILKQHSKKTLYAPHYLQELQPFSL